MKNSRRKLILLLFLSAFLVGFHQYMYYTVWFQPQDISHETVIVSLLFGGFLVWLLPNKK